MLILNKSRFIAAPFDAESEIETVVVQNADYLFGPNSVYLPKVLIRSPEGFGTIPDGYAIDLDSKRWFLIEAELASHSVWNHIAPQVSKQIIASTQAASRALLIESVIDLYRKEESIRSKFDEMEIEEIDVRRVLSEIFERRPIVGIPIDAINKDLREWAQTLNTEVRLWLVRKLVDFANPTIIAYELPDEFTPSFETTQVSTGGTISTTQAERAVFDVSMRDLIMAGLLQDGETLFFTYGPRGGIKKTFEATVNTDGSLLLSERRFSSVSDAAVFCIQQAGSNRQTENGWRVWKNKEGVLLQDLRDQLLDSKTSGANGT